MKSSIHILHLEDRRKDAQLVQSTLEAEGIQCAITWVKSRDDFVAALEHGDIDLILSDFALPHFDGMSALKIARAGWPAIPFVLVSGTMGEERAIESLQSGATDYVLKDRLVRLTPAVRRAMQESENRAERGRLEVQFIEAQKMEVIGQLASGVAHDFNNIIAIIICYSDLIRDKLGPDNVVESDLEAIGMAAQRAAGLTRQLLLFSRKQEVQPIVLDLSEVVGGVEKMLRRLIDEHIELTFALGQETGRVKGDPGYVGQLLMNLVVNARDAMPNGGQITIATNNVLIDETCAGTHPGINPGEYVMLSVSDTGTGMSKDVQARLFEAFFTTKPKGKGTGLGLTTCRNIVQQSGGHLIVASEVGKGTTFKAYFPQVDLPLDAAAIPIQKEPLPHGTETVLVVEDEPTLRNMARRVLEAQGYEVLTAANGQEGLRVVREHKRSSVRLVITDVIMPQMGGKVMAEWMQTADPDLKILFTSGYTDDAITKHGALESGVEFLPKPYGPATLARKVREMLDAPQRVSAHESLIIITS